MIEEGARVKLRPGSQLAQQHPEMLDAIGVVGSILRGPSWHSLGVSTIKRLRDVSAHVRFQDLNLIALNVTIDDLEAADHLNPELCAD